MYFEDDLSVPPLIPIKAKKKKYEDTSNEPAHLSNNEVMEIFAKEFDKMHPQKESAKAEKQPQPLLTPQKLDEIDKKFSNLQEKTSRKVPDKQQTVGPKKDKELQKAKFMVGDIMKKIDAKNISEELYPITNQTIVGNIKRIQLEIQELKIEAQRKENLLVSNPNNQHLRKQLQGLKHSIDRCVTIKQLYNEKINLRNKVSILERSIIKLKEDNENMKIKINQDQEAIELHSQGQPCQKEKQLKEELLRVKLDLKKVTEIKEQLENNVADIIQSFKRLYEEADAARLIVVKKLAEIQEKEKFTESDKASSEKKSLNGFGKQEKSPKPSFQNSNLEMTQRIRTAIPVNDRGNPGQEKTTVKGKGLSLQQQLKKMKSNQTNSYGYKR